MISMEKARAIALEKAPGGKIASPPKQETKH
jgi:uncharacterized membrane protein YkoI